MTKLAASEIATALALAMLGGSTITTAERQNVAHAEIAAPAVSEPGHIMHIGQCRIEYRALAPDRQPAPMECEHAEWIAQRWGGRVVEKTGEGLVERAAYEGRNDFTGVPASALPRAGWCRAWIEGLAAKDQPAASDCRTARRTASAHGGRVLFMPL